MVPFEMKQERQRVSECIERLIQLSLSDGSVVQSEESPPQLWDTFMSHLSQNYEHLLHRHKDGKYVRFAVLLCCSLRHCRFSLPSPCVLVLDDNFPLRSMRYPFYQMAKKCVCLHVHACGQW